MTARARIGTAAVVVAVVVVNLWAVRTHALADLSADRRFRLQPETRAIVAEVDAPLDITVFVVKGGGFARDADFLLERYHELNRNISHEIVDPDEHPGEAARLGVEGYATVVFEYEGRRTETATATEIQVSSAILRLLRGDAPLVCWLTGHGEGSLGDDGPDGLSEVSDLLDQNGYRTRDVSLVDGSDVPADCAALVVAGARVPLRDAELSTIEDWTAAAGRLMVLATPLSSADPNPILQPWGITFVGGLVVDLSRNEGLDLSNVIVEDLPSFNPVVDGVPSLQLPAGGGLVLDAEPRSGLTLSTLAVTSADSFVETEPDVELRFSPGDFPGPIVVAAAADDSRVEESGEDRLEGLHGPRVVRTRVLATGNAEWLSNRFLGALGNRRFLANALGWLTEVEQVLTVGTSEREDRSMSWTPERERRVAAVTVVGGPLLVVAAGVVSGLARRRRGQRRDRR